MNREALLEEFERLLDNLNHLPPNAAHTFVTHADLASVLNLILMILKN